VPADAGDRTAAVSGSGDRWAGRALDRCNGTVPSWRRVDDVPTRLPGSPVPRVRRRGSVPANSRRPSCTAPSAGGGGPDPDPCYHIGCDDLDNVDIERVALFAEVTAAVVRELMAED